MRAPNGVPGNENPEGLVAVRLFPNQGLGYGFGPTSQGIGDGLPPGYHRTVNMTVQDGKRFSPSFGVHFRDIGYSSAQPMNAPPSYLVGWRDGDGNPIALDALGHVAHLLTDGAIAAESDATSNIYGSACFHDNGGGTEYLYAGTFTAATGAPAFLNRRTPAGTWAEDADVNAKYIVSIAGALWRSTSDYQVSVCPAASEPFTVGNWGSSIQVGTNAAKIVNIAGLGAVVVIFKEDGIYFYDETETRFVNRYEVPWSEYHFPFVKPDGEGGLYTSTAGGELVHIGQFGTITTLRLLEGKEPGRDTPAGQIVDMTLDGADLLMLMAPGYRLGQPSGLKVLKTTDNFGTFTDYSTAATDNSGATVIDLSSLDTLANGDALLVGFDDQFLAVQFVEAYDESMNSTPSNMSGAVSTGAGTWGSVTLFDGTYNGATLAEGGVVAIKPSSNISGWVKATYATFSKYWLRLTFSMALDAAVRPAGVFILPRRAAPAFAPTNFPNGYVWEASGMQGKVLRGRRRGAEIIVDDIYTLTAVGTAGQPRRRTPGGNKIAKCALSTGNSPRASIVVISRDEVVQYPLSPTKEPMRTPYPVLARDATNDIAPVLYPQPVDFGLGLWSLRFIELSGEDFVAETDGWKVAFRWGTTEPWWTSPAYNSGHALIELPGGNKGQVLHTAIQIIDGSQVEAWGPSGRDVIAWVKPLDEEAWRHRPRPAEQPAVG